MSYGKFAIVLDWHKGLAPAQVGVRILCPKTTWIFHIQRQYTFATGIPNKGWTFPSRILWAFQMHLVGQQGKQNAELDGSLD